MAAEELRPYRKALIDAGIRQSLALVSDLEGDPRAEFQRLDAYQVLARVQAEGSDFAAAIETTRKAIALAERLVAQDPAAIRPRIALATSLHRASAILPDDPSRRAAAQRSNAILQSIPSVNDEFKKTESAGLIAINHYNIGNDHLFKGRYAEALTAFEAAQAAYDDLLERGDPNPQTRDLAARNLLYLCRAYPADRRALALAAGRRAESTFRTLVREYPDHFDFVYQLNLVQDELGQRFTNAERWDEAILSFEEAHQTLKEMASRHGNLVSRMATIQARIAAVDINLLNAYASSDPVKYAAASRTLNAEVYEICDKLGLVQPLSWNSRVAYALTSFALADYQAQDGLSPDLELIRKAERLWEQAGRESPNNLMVNENLAVVRRRLAEELADRGHRDEAARWASPIARHGSGQRRAALSPGHRVRPGRGTHRQVAHQIECGAASQAPSPVRS